ncbi:hypothetical protein FC18_GL001503 [Lacticaseibacillus sharpeae JCM 1186 = DSM 20505]|uniref:Uncharacterized protein n=1 Tax=Lacticaseibacillus sharpeae JCM 1186 = DSM 20505 TaxID=1291052 RepID=A0A0R1ZU95_9LACO|nr:hypothetical protein FC18_GL001503 [Lacticaseibacillus sharpeae JCM 1186 = DSM 20505]
MYYFLQANKPQYNFTQRFGLEITRISKYEWSLVHDFDDNVGFLIKKDIQPFSNMNQTSFEYLAHKLIYCDKSEYNFIADFIVTKKEGKTSVAHAATYAFMYMSDDVFRLVMLHMLFFQDIFLT